jgi:DNA-directed RNA polymerase specialized sigma24 family protein
LARAFERWRRVSIMDSSTGWTYRVAFNIIRRRARRRGLERTAFGRVRTDDVPGPTGELWLLVADLPPRQRTAVLLHAVGSDGKVSETGSLGEASNTCGAGDGRTAQPLA